MSNVFATHTNRRLACLGGEIYLLSVGSLYFSIVSIFFSVSIFIDMHILATLTAETINFAITCSKSI